MKGEIWRPKMSSPVQEPRTTASQPPPTGRHSTPAISAGCSAGATSGLPSTDGTYISYPAGPWTSTDGCCDTIQRGISRRPAAGRATTRVAPTALPPLDSQERSSTAGTFTTYRSAMRVHGTGGCCASIRRAASPQLRAGMPTTPA